MRNLVLLATLGATAGFAATVNHASAHACRCTGHENWGLELDRVSHAADRDLWKRWLYYSEFNDGYKIMGVRFQLDLSATP